MTRLSGTDLDDMHDDGWHIAVEEIEHLRTLNAKFAQRDLTQIQRMFEMEQEIGRLRAERDALARWKSTHAPRVAALEGLLSTAQLEAAAGQEARATLQSEREANSILTSERDELYCELGALHEVRYEDTKLLRQALEALLGADRLIGQFDEDEDWRDNAKAAIAALRERLGNGR